MPEPREIERAYLQPVKLAGGRAQELGGRIPVQFNPESLKVSFANQSSGGDQRGGGATQFVARGTTKLSFDLWFDATRPQPEGPPVDDVRKLTEKVVAFLKPRSDLQGAPPAMRFHWGTFLFEGTVESINENLELFSEDGRPLRAGVSVSLSQQEIQFQFGQPSGRFGAASGAPGAVPLQQARQGDSVQAMAARQGRPEDWQGVAAANGIENPRRLRAGQSLDLGGRR